MIFERPNRGLKIRLPLFKKRSGSDRGSRDSAQPCCVAIGKISFAVLVKKSVCPIGASLGGFLRRSGNLSTTFSPSS
jgi:hypothetical protein